MAMDGKGIDVVRSRRVYKFDELDARGRREALETVAKWLADTLDPDTIGMAVESLAADKLSPGYDDERHVAMMSNLDVRWSLSYCQGDGVAFHGTLNREDAEALTWPDYVTAVRFDHVGRYTHEQSFTITYVATDQDGDEWDVAESTGYSVRVLLDNVLDRGLLFRQCEVFDTEVRHLCRAVADGAYAWMDSQSDESAAVAYLRECAEPYQFDANGYREPYYWWSDTPNPTHGDER
jgi:hypothetical protein